MYAIKGTCNGLFGIFKSKWKAKKASKQLWNIKFPKIEVIDVKKVDETLYEIRKFKTIKEK